MDKSSQNIMDILQKTEPLMQIMNSLPLETSVGLYKILGVLARTATENISQIDPELRVTICDWQDKILDRIVDLDVGSMKAASDIYTPAIHEYRRWNNVELIKDKGLVGYTLAKEIGAQAIMYFGTKPSDYPYLSNLPEMKLLCDESASGNEGIYYTHLKEHYNEMGILILHGLYFQTIDYLNNYRKLRPDGKVFCSLDMNGEWMNRIKWDLEFYQKFVGQCDITATSCRSIRDALNRNSAVHFPCHWFANAFFNPNVYETNADPKKKENIILTVGRIGSRQKNNVELIVAFAKIYDLIPDWKLQLVGPIEPEFQMQMETAFSAYPDLKSRIILTGAIIDKSELFKEYAKAKIFVLTSAYEGGTPNVYAEALVHGCMFVTSDIDAADDITNFGELGITYPLGEIDALSDALISICTSADEQAFKTHIPKALAYAAKYFDWTRNAKKLAFMLFGQAQEHETSN